MLSQVSIFAENKKGRLQNITSLLQKENINIWGSITNDSAEYGIIRMVVSNPEHAEKVLAEAGYLCRLTEVLGVELDDEVGALQPSVNFPRREQYQCGLPVSLLQS